MPRRKRRGFSEEENAYYLDHLIEVMEDWEKVLGSKKNAAEACGVCSSYWRNAVNGNCMPGPKILRGLGIVRRYQYRKAGADD